jgi:glucans biosynthesis protein
MWLLAIPLWICASTAWTAEAGTAKAGDFDFARTVARDLAAAPFQGPPPELPKALRELNYDQMRNLRFDPRQAVWKQDQLPFQLQFFHPAGILNDQVTVHLVEAGVIREYPLSSGLFEYGKAGLDAAAVGPVRFSGFRIHYPLNTPEYSDELAVFQGATYFRVLARDLIYGLSARAIAINCGGPGAEEFPRFREFWIHRPNQDDPQIRVVGVFDGPSVAGAADFVIKPGKETLMKCRVALFARTDIARYGIAPLTSMYWYGKTRPGRFDDYRPEVHDSDGLLLQDRQGGWLWRTLDNDGRLRWSTFPGTGIRGFGLLQRERSYACYQDFEAIYQRRPSVWVQPIGDWGEGTLKLLELPAHTEYQDNIVAFWEPAQPLKAGKSIEFAYQLAWFLERADLSAAGRLLQARSSGIPGDVCRKRFMLEFAWPGLTAGTAGIPEFVVTAAGGAIQGQSAVFNPYTNAWRVSFEAVAENKTTPMEMRAFVRQKGAACTETWNYSWTP